MLLPLILRILDQHQIQPKIVAMPKSDFKSELAAAAEETSGQEKIDAESGNAAESLKVQNPEIQSPNKPATSPSLEELLKTITKFEQSNQSRVVDVFE